MGVPDEQKKADPFFNAKIRREVNGVFFDGEVEDIEIGRNSRELLYRVKYSDGDLEHFTADMCKQFRLGGNKAGSKEKAEPKAKGKAKAAAKEDAPSPKAKGKAEARAKA